MAINVNAKRIIPYSKDITLINYLKYWFENIYSIRIENSTKMLGAYVLYDLILLMSSKSTCNIM